MNEADILVKLERAQFDGRRKVDEDQGEANEN